MKINLIYVFIEIITDIICIIIITIFCILWLLEHPHVEWKKPSNVPISAVWVGGYDGGNWMDLVDIRVDTIRLRIYHCTNGALELDADFVYENCNNLQLTELNWHEYLNDFDGAIVYTNIVLSSKYCLLVPILPVHYVDHEEGWLKIVEDYYLIKLINGERR